MINKKIITLGDSITKGYNGVTTNPNNSYPNWIKKLLNLKIVKNEGENAATLSGHRDKDFTQKVNQINFSPYDIVTIAYGTNDYAHETKSLKEINHILTNNIKNIKKKNPNIKILGILPISRFDNKKSANLSPGLAGYTFNDLLKQLAQTYTANNIPYLDWRIDSSPIVNENNYENTLYDKHLHPNNETYHKMGIKIANFIKNNAK